MKILLINPAPKHYTRARCSPLGVLSIASYLNANGHTAKVLNRAITSTDIAAELDEFRPDFIGCSLLTVMAGNDSINVSKEAKKDIEDVLRQFRGHDLKFAFNLFCTSVYEFSDIFLHAHCYPKILKKYGLK